MKTKIEVKAEHIKNGLQGSCHMCPVALAINERLGFDYFSVGSSHITYAKSLSSINKVVAPRSVLRFIRKFDDNKPVKPFNFILDI